MDLKPAADAQRTRKKSRHSAPMRNVAARLLAVSAGPMKDARPQKNSTNGTRTSDRTNASALSETTGTWSLAETGTIEVHLSAEAGAVAGPLSDVVREKERGTDNRREIQVEAGTRAITVLTTSRETSIRRST